MTTQESFDGDLPDCRGTCGVGVIDPQFGVNMGSIVRSAACYGADFVFSTKPYGKQTTAVGHETNIPVFDNAYLETIVPPNADLIAIEYTEDSVPLRRFRHPEHAVYAAGCESRGVPDDVLERADRTVHLSSAYCENVATAAAIVLHDRLAQQLDREDAAQATATARATAVEIDFERWFDAPIPETIRP